MPARHAVHALVATAATAAAVLAARWWVVRVRRRAGQGASAARAPWRRTAPAPDPAHAGHRRVAELHAALLEPQEHPGFVAADAELDRYWKSIAPLYP